MAYQPGYPQPSTPHPGPMMGDRVKKRIIVCCDGTWQDGIIVKERWKYTNVLRLSRSISHEDARFNPPIPQVVYYQSGIGSEQNFYSEYVQGATGASLGEKVEEGYGFISQNYQPGDEIFLFGFSRGAYTARMIAAFIGSIGVLDVQDMTHFAQLFVDFQKRGKTKDKAEIAELDLRLSPWTGHDSPGKKRADSGPHSFSIKCVGVFDTVGSLGLPEELTLHSAKMTTIFGFSDHTLGEHVEFAFHALALNETRADFNCAKFEQTPGGRAKGQLLKQCWFTGSHSDIGGGWHDHDLADLSFYWMASNVVNLLSLNFNYMATFPEPCYPWGNQPPHDPRTGIFSLATKITRQLPKVTDDVTHETIHPSVVDQTEILAQLQANITANPALITPLMPFEEEMRKSWPYVPGKYPPQAYKSDEKPSDAMHKSLIDAATFKATKLGQQALHDITHSEVVKSATQGGAFEKSWLGRHVDETPFGAHIHEWTDKIDKL